MENQPIIKKCPYCQKQISSNTTKCPYCGKDFKNWFKQHPFLTILIGFFVFSNMVNLLSSVFSSSDASVLKESTKKSTDQMKIDGSLSPAKKNNIDVNTIKEGKSTNN